MARPLVLCLFAAMALLVSAVPARGVGAGDIAATPDGRHVYMSTGLLHGFARNSSTGDLTQLRSPSAGDGEIAIAPDGRFLYVAKDGSVIVHARDPATGALRGASTVATGIGSPVTSLAMAPDGHHLYAAHMRSNAIVTFGRDPGSGSLGVTGTIYGGPGEVEWMEHPADLALSPDGRSLYVAILDGVAGLARDPQSGALTPLDRPPSTSTAFAVAVSPDGRRVYAGRGSYAAYERSSESGALTPVNGFNPRCERAPFCNEGWSLAVHPDGGGVFSTAHFERRLSQAAVTAEGVSPETSYFEGVDGARGLDDPLELDWAPDGRHLYVGEGAVYTPTADGDFAISDRRVSAVASYRWDPYRRRLSFGSLWEPRPPDSGGSSDNTVTINDGARFANSRDVILTVNPAVGASELTIANEETFADGVAVAFAEDRRYRWRLVDVGIGRDVRRVHVRAENTLYDRPSHVDMSDDIILDTRSPQLASARLVRWGRGGARAARRRISASLVLRARDNRSGVRRVQVTTRRARPGRTRRFKRRIALRGKQRRLYVRVFDGAGNRSRWRTVRPITKSRRR